MTAFTLVHSPLVGPGTWAPTGAELRRRGYEVVVPSLVAAASTGSWEACVAAAVRGAYAGNGDHVVAGHSGAGPLLPVVAARLRTAPARLVFVDAAVPPASGDAALVPDAFLDRLRALAVRGRLPKWSEWFGPDAMARLVPDAALRDALVAELPELPLSYFEARVPMPAGWSSSACAYVLLSDAYRADADDARSRGWPVTELAGMHLDPATRPREVAGALAAIAAG